MDRNNARSPGMFMAEVDSVHPAAPYPRIHKHQPRGRRDPGGQDRPSDKAPGNGLTDDQGQRSDDDDASLVDDYA